MTLSPRLRQILPAATQEAWSRIPPAVPDSAYLAGGTAVAVHLAHRQSRDLDFFITEPFDPQQVASTLSSLGEFTPTLVSEGTLNGSFLEAKVQFLDASSQRILEPLTDVDGIRVAGLGDLLATKLNAIGGRGELRDYYDLWKVETLGHLSVEEGLRLYVMRYTPDPPEPSLLHIVRALGYLDDLVDDTLLPPDRDEVPRYWRQRHPSIVRALSNFTRAN